MKTVTSILCIFGGAIAAYLSVIFTTSRVSKAIAREEGQEYARHKAVIEKMTTIFAGTESERFIPVYTNILNDIRKKFRNDYVVILEQLEKTISDTQPIEIVEKNVETLLCALDIIRDFYTGKQFKSND